MARPGSGTPCPESPLPPPNRQPLALRWLTEVWPGVVTFAVHFYTAAPTVTGEDSGELITAAYFFGVPHPPGYPIWTFLCGIWTHVVPFGSIAWRANLFSGLCTAVAVVLLGRALRRLGISTACAGIAAAAAGLTDLVWSQSVISEVYTLNLAFMAAIMLCFANWYRSRTARWLYWAAFLFGVGMANHHILGFAALGLGLWAIWVSPLLIRRLRLIGFCTLLFLVGLMPYLYLPWAARRDVPVKWGETTSIAQVWRHVSRSQYKGADDEAPMPLTAGLLAGRFDYAARWVARQWTPLLLPVVVCGLVALSRRRRHRPLVSLVLLLGVSCGPLYLAIGGPKLDAQDQKIQEVFLSPLAFVSAIPLAAGLEWIALSLLVFSRTFNARGMKLERKTHVLIGSTCVCALLIAHGPSNNLRNYWYALDHADNLLACMLPNAVVFPSGDHDTFPLIYRICVERHRTDVLIADKYGYIDLDLYRDMPNNPGKPRTPHDRDRIEEWLIRALRRPVYYTVKKQSPVENASVVPVGLVYHLLPHSQTIDAESCWRHIAYRNLAVEKAPEDWAASYILTDFFFAKAAQALQKKDEKLARDTFAECIDHCRGIRETLNNVASALAEGGMVDEAIEYYEQACRSDWRYGPARWNLAKIFNATGRRAWAAKIFEDLTAASPEDFRPCGELGFIYRDFFESPELARTWWYESLRRNPQQPQIIEALASLEHGSRPKRGEPNAPTTQPAELSIETDDASSIHSTDSHMPAAGGTALVPKAGVIVSPHNDGLTPNETTSHMIDIAKRTQGG